MIAHLSVTWLEVKAAIRRNSFRFMQSLAVEVLLTDDKEMIHKLMDEATAHTTDPASLETQVQEGYG